MKKLFCIIIIAAIIAGITACSDNSSSSSGATATLKAGKKVEIYYFHFTRRCATCMKVETVSKEVLETQYPEQVKKGDIFFQSVNLDEKDGATLGEKFKIEGQTLIVICGNKSIDLTEKAFMYAVTAPEKLKAEINKAIEEVMK
jgi:hypothetical protein